MNDVNTFNKQNAPLNIHNSSNRLSLDFPQDSKSKRINIFNQSSKCKVFNIIKQQINEENIPLNVDGNNIKYCGEIKFKETPQSQNEEKNIDEKKRGKNWIESSLINDVNQKQNNMTNQYEIRDQKYVHDEEMHSQQFMLNNLDIIQETLIFQNKDMLSSQNRQKELFSENNLKKKQLRSELIVEINQDKNQNDKKIKRISTQNNAQKKNIKQIQHNKNAEDKQKDLIIIQDNNYDSIKKQQQDYKSETKEQEIESQLQFKSQDKNNRSSEGNNWMQVNSGNDLKNSQSQKRFNQMRKQMNQNRLKDFPDKFYDSDQQDKPQNNQNQIQFQEFNKPTTESIIALEEELEDSVFNQLKKPPQVPSLGSKIQQAQKQQISQLPEGQMFSEKQSAGVSGISTVGGNTGNGIQADQEVCADYLSNKNAYIHSRQDGFDVVKRKNSSILNTANRYFFQINTPSALGYTSVLLEGTSNTLFPYFQTQNLYQNLQYHEDTDKFAQQLFFDSDRILIEQYRQNEHFKLLFDPLGEANNPFINLFNDQRQDSSINE